MEIGSKEAKTGLVLIIIGFLFVLNNFDVFDFGNFIWRLWPLLLIWWGYSMLRKRGRHSSEDSKFQVFGDTIETTTSPYIRHSSAFGDVRIKIDSGEFAGGNASSVFGKVSIDLQSVTSISGYGQLDLHSVFGDILIRLPKSLPFKVRGSSPFGSLTTPEGAKITGKEYKSPDFDSATERLIIRASQVFGDIELIE